MLRFMLLLMVGVVVLMARSSALIALLPDQELVAAADLVIVGTVLEDQRVEGLPGRVDGRAVARIDRVLKGEATGNLVVWHAMPPMPSPGVVIMDHGGFELPAQSQWLFFLQRSPGGYSITGGLIGRRQIGLEAHYAAIINSFPVQVTLQQPIAPFYFEREVPVSVMVKNLGQTPLRCYQPMLEGFYYSPRFGATISFRPMVRRADVVGSVVLEPVTVQPNETKTMTLSFVTPQPQSWQVFTPDSYLLTPISLRARVYVDLLGTAPQTRFNAASGWVDTLTGFDRES